MKVGEDTLEAGGDLEGSESQPRGGRPGRLGCPSFSEARALRACEPWRLGKPTFRRIHRPSFRSGKVTYRALKGRLGRPGRRLSPGHLVNLEGPP